MTYEDLKEDFKDIVAIRRAQGVEGFSLMQVALNKKILETLERIEAKLEAPKVVTEKEEEVKKAPAKK